MATLFTRIIEREIPGVFVWDDDRAVAFMSINPLRPGHTLVVPRQEIDHWIDCPPDLMAHLMEVAAEIGRAQEQVYRPERVGLVVAGLEVPHLHIHVVPIDNARDLDFANAASSVASEEIEEQASSIRYVLRSLGAKGVVGGADA
jgi:diadenosine tetraphosphate (Ap4A) HIT family hydrolase